MMIKFLKYTTIGEQLYKAGEKVDLSVFDKILDDGRLVYHMDREQKYTILRPENFELIYSSYEELKAFKDAPRHFKDCHAEIYRLMDEIRELKKKIAE